MRKSKYRLLLANFPGTTNFFSERAPITVDSQSVTSDTLTALRGYLYYDPSKYDLSKVERFEVQVEWESAGAGDVDVYDFTNNAKIADVATPTGATGYTVTITDVTSYLKSLTSPILIGIVAAGDGTNAVTVHRSVMRINIKL